MVVRNMANGPGWTFLSNHAHVLLCIAKEPEVRLREVAHRVGITERAVQRIVADLEEGGYLSRSREGRRNRYEVHLDRPLRHSVESHREVGVLLNLILRPDQPDPGDRRDLSESAGHFPVVAGFGEAAGGLVPPVALTAGSSVPFWPNGPGMPAGGGAGGSGGRIAGSSPGTVSGTGGAGAGTSSIRAGSS